MGMEKIERRSLNQPKIIIGDDGQKTTQKNISQPSNKNIASTGSRELLNRSNLSDYTSQKQDEELRRLKSKLEKLKATYDKELNLVKTEQEHDMTRLQRENFLLKTKISEVQQEKNNSADHKNDNSQNDITNPEVLITKLSSENEKIMEKNKKIKTDFDRKTDLMVEENRKVLQKLAIIEEERYQLKASNEVLRTEAKLGSNQLKTSRSESSKSPVREVQSTTVRKPLTPKKVIAPVENHQNIQNQPPQNPTPNSNSFDTNQSLL